MKSRRKTKIILFVATLATAVGFTVASSRHFIGAAEITQEITQADYEALGKPGATAPPAPDGYVWKLTYGQGTILADGQYVMEDSHVRVKVMGREQIYIKKADFIAQQAVGTVLLPAIGGLASTSIDTVGLIEEPAQDRYYTVFTKLP